MKKAGIGLLFVFTMLLVNFSPAQQVETNIIVGNGPCAIAYDTIDQRLFVANNGGSSVSVINPELLSVVTTIPTTHPPVAAVWNPNNNQVYVACAPMTGDGSVVVIDPGTNQIIDEITVGANPITIVLNRSRNKLYCLNRTSNTITVINCANNQTITDINLQSQSPKDMIYNPVNDMIYVTSEQYMQNSKVRAINCANDQIAATMDAGRGAGALAVNTISNRVYVANAQTNNVTIINGATNSVIATMSTQSEPTPLLWIPTNKLFVGEYWNNTVGYLHGDSTRIRGRVSNTTNPKTLLYVPETERVYCTSYLGGVVNVINARNGEEQLIITLTVGGGPTAMLYYPPQNRVFVANFWENTVTSIKDASGIEEFPATPGISSHYLITYPNPVLVNSTVSFRTNGFSPKEFVVTNSAGQILYRGNTGSWTANKPGIYFCTAVGTDGNRLTSKFIVE